MLKENSGIDISWHVTQFGSDADHIYFFFATETRHQDTFQPGAEIEKEGGMEGPQGRERLGFTIFYRGIRSANVATTSHGAYMADPSLGSVFSVVSAAAFFFGDP